MKELLLTIPRMLEEVLKKVEGEELNTSEERKKETKKLLANLRNITTEMREIAESQQQADTGNLFKMLGNLQNLQGGLPSLTTEQLSKLGDSSELASLLDIQDSLKELPTVSEAVKVLSPLEQVKELQSLKEGNSGEKSAKTQPQADGVDSTEE